MTASHGGHDIVHASHVRLAYRALLGRFPSEEEVVLQLAGVRTTGELLQVLTAAPEFTGTANVLADAPVEPLPTVVNVWTPELADWTHPAGTVSPDGTATVGTGGWVFLTGGPDAMLDQHLGRHPLDRGWDDGWSRLLEVRREAAARIDVQLVHLVVPDKLAALDAHLEDLPAVAGPRPVLRLAEREPGALLYPLTELLATAGAFQRTDTHLAVAGHAAVAQATLAALGADPLGDLPGTVPGLRSGDLGRRFLPPILEVAQAPQTFGAASLAEDNRDDVARQLGFLGTRRVLRNAAATDPRTVVVFGESAAYPGLESPGLAWFLAQRFAEVHFVWAPLGWDPDYVTRAGATVVVSATTERLLRRLPLPSFDARALVTRAAQAGEPPAPESLVFASAA